MPDTHSITATRSFQNRLLHAERWRLGLMLACCMALSVMMVVRRALGGTVASDDSVFPWVMGILIFACVSLCGAIVETTWRLRRGLAFPRWKVLIGAAMDLCVPYAVLVVLHFNSPLGAHAALSGPALLVVPIVIMLSVLRLRPSFSVTLGLLAAVAHALLTFDTHRSGGIDPHEYPRLYSYSVILAIHGFAAGVLAVIVRRYIQEAVREAGAAERSARELAAIAHELDIARDIQRNLLPSEPPEMPGFDIAGMARPATQAGGDYYDWQPLPNGTLVVAIADVTGHGIGPALVMAVCRAYARATAPSAISAASFLERMNALIAKDVSGGRFITMAVVVLGPGGDAEMISAGHGPTFLYRASTGKVEQFGGSGLPLGIVEDERYGPTSHLQLDPGDTLVLLTDGFMERACADGSIFGTNRLISLVERHAALSAKQIIDAIDQAVTAFAAGTPQSDDMTAVVLKRV
ncbi:MAG: PP2C family protein-serine/threonine phosphatase [Phycisphaeraceae bacterium]|nr:PP2C family protein-serine/threonine phosphatase [Phycisphaerae bacterium]MBX3393512.1 PP2C family protein-serine/threonine phosphatase [Phycisphaeraceae bacterium]